MRFPFRFDSGKARIQTIWNIYTVLADAAVLLLWSILRPRPWPYAILVGVIALVLWGLLLPLAMISSMVLHWFT